MLFAEVIREAGFSVEDFPVASQIPVTVFDRKDRLVETDSLKYVEELFAHNSGAKSDFERFLNSLEECPFTLPELTLRIDEEMVAVNYKTADLQRFSRRPALDPLDYMD